MILSLLASLALLPGCPVFTEFLPDPQAFPDAVGEYIEVSWEPSPLDWDTLWFQFEDSPPFFWVKNSDSTHRLLLHRNATESCPIWRHNECAPLLGPALPNSRTFRWVVRAGICRDTVDVPSSSPGVAWQRSGPLPTDWVASTTAAPPEKSGSPGLPDPSYESIPDDCVTQVQQAFWKEKAWHIHLSHQGCQHKTIQIETQDSETGAHWDQSILVHDSLILLPSVQASGSLWLRRTHPLDGNPINDTLDTLLILPGFSPLRITEVSPCPLENYPEWFEISNVGQIPIPLIHVGDCKKVQLQSPKVLAPGKTILFTQDSVGLRNWMGFSDQSIVQAPIQTLKNTVDTLRLCHKSLVLDSVFWGKNNPPPCPNSFSPIHPHSPPSAGYLPRIQAKSQSPKLRANHKILSRSNSRASLQITWQSQSTGTLSLLDPQGLTIIQKELPPNDQNLWVELTQWRQCPLGPCFIHFSTAGQYETTLGIIVTP